MCVLVYCVVSSSSMSVRLSSMLFVSNEIHGLYVLLVFVQIIVARSMTACCHVSNIGVVRFSIGSCMCVWNHSFCVSSGFTMLLLLGVCSSVLDGILIFVLLMTGS